MDTQEQDNITGKLIREYQNNEREIACICYTLRGIGERLAALGHLLQDDPSQVTIGDDYLRSSEGVRPEFYVSTGRLEEARALMHEYRKAVEAKRKMERDLATMGLEGFIR